MTTTVIVDWSAAQHTTSSSNAQKPELRRQVIRVPRAAMAACWPMAWDELERAAFAGEHGAEPRWIYGTDIAPSDYAYLREGRSDDHSLRGKSMLYSQGW